jgi:hypothetical protein
MDTADGFVAAVVSNIRQFLQISDIILGISCGLGEFQCLV